ncbi:MAG TPA: hypothetical protein VHW92_12910 [Mycobacteriales bacterium]|jgi:hypothetical protein|nr:hypothetical protein [Mycobacteriales bacterium]
MNLRAVRHVAAVAGVIAAVATLPTGAAVAGTTTAGHAQPAGKAHGFDTFKIPAGQPLSATQQLVTALASAPDAAAAGRLWLRSEAKAALAQFAPKATVASSSSGAEAGDPLEVLEELLIPAGDLAGKGHRDVLDTRVSENESTIAITARDATTGSRVWQRVSHSEDQQVMPLSVSPVGKSGRPGLLVEKQTLRLTNHGNTIRVAQSVAAWSGKTGKTLWTSKPVVGSLTFSETSLVIHNLPATTQVLQVLPARPLDVLTTTNSFSLSTSGPTAPNTTAATLVSGRTGATRAPYPVLSSPLFPPSLLGVDDLNGDGLADVVGVSAEQTSGVATAYKGDTGAKLWSRKHGIDPFAFPVSVGRVSSGRGNDLALEGFLVSLVRGRSGSVLWTRLGSAVTLLRPAGHGRPGLVGLANELGQGSPLTRRHNTFTRGIDVRAITASNHVVWHRVVKASVHSTAQHNFGSLEAYPIGATRAGGASAIAVRASVTAGLTYVNKEGLIDGDTGKFRSATIGSPAAGSLVRGRGVDLLHTSATPEGVDLSGYDGATGERIVHVLVPTPGFVEKPLASGMRATGHDCSDIALGGLYTHHRVVVYMLSGSGAPLWSLEYGEGRAEGGKLIHFPAPQHFCAA